MNPKISVVSPVYRGEKMVQMLVDRNVAVLQKMQVNGYISDFEIILVNDASPDNSWDMIVAACDKNKHVKGIDLSRNFGQHYAITAGLRRVSGDWIVVMDCDLQDTPEDIPFMFEKAMDGYDIVQTKRVVKHVGWLKKMSSVCFHSVFSWISGKKSDPTLGNYGIYRRDVIDVFNSLPQQSRSFGTLLDFLGFKKTYYEIEQAERAEGKSSYTLTKMLKLSFDIMIVNSNKPLRLAVGLGLTMSTLSFLLAIYNVVARLTGIISVAGYTTTVFSIWFVGGIMLFVLGIVGLYIGKIYDQVKGQPLYIEREIINFE